MNPRQLALAALAVCVTAFASPPPLARADDHDHHDGPHVLPEAAGVAPGVGFYSYDAPLPPAQPASTSVPVFNSRPEARVQLYLDFDGVDFGTLSWSGKMPGLRPAYDIDGDPSQFNTEELSRIEQVWSRVSEAYSMFDVNVTTVDPGNYDRLESLHMVISGNNSWYGGGGGVAFVSGFASAGSGMVRRTGWVFPGNLRAGDAKVVADATIHEAGHLFGLVHQGGYDIDGALIDPYDSNSQSDTRAPNLGVAYNARRGLWAIGANVNNSVFVVDELSVIGSSYNGFGFVPDEPGAGFDSAEAFDLSTSLPAELVSGVIATSDDVDYYRFSLSDRSLVDLLLDVAAYGPNLDARLMLYDADLALLHDDDPVLTTSRESLTASFTGVLAAGDYYLAIGSHGGYTYDNGPGVRTLHDAGQYFLWGSAVAGVPEPAAAALLAFAAACGFARRRRTA